MLKIVFNVSTVISSLILLNACSNTSAKQHLENVRDGSEERITVGKVQRTIRIGMTNADVVETLGSPNIVSTDEQRREVWVYDKISTETVYSTSATGGGISALMLGFSTGAPIAGGGGIGANSRKSTGAQATSQRTLTIIIKFNKQGAVRDIAYHSSQF